MEKMLVSSNVSVLSVEALARSPRVAMLLRRAMSETDASSAPGHASLIVLRFAGVACFLVQPTASGRHKAAAGNRQTRSKNREYRSIIERFYRNVVSGPTSFLAGYSTILLLYDGHLLVATNQKQPANCTDILHRLFRRSDTSLNWTGTVKPWRAGWGDRGAI
jgi:hypothetical protein